MTRRGMNAYLFGVWVVTTLIFSAFGLCALSAPVIYVDPNASDTGESTFRSLQQALEAAEDGTTIIIRSGVYGAVTIDGNGLTLHGHSGPDAGPEEVQIAAPVRVTGSGIRLENLTIGTPGWEEPALLVEGVVDEVNNCVIHGQVRCSNHLHLLSNTVVHGDVDNMRGSVEYCWVHGGFLSL